MRGRESSAREGSPPRRARCSGAASARAELGEGGPGHHHGALTALLLPRLRSDHDGSAKRPSRTTPLLCLGDRPGPVSLRAARFHARGNAASSLCLECGIRKRQMVDAQKLGRRNFGETALHPDPPMSGSFFSSPKGRAGRVDARRTRIGKRSQFGGTGVRGCGACSLRGSRRIMREIRDPPS